MKIYKSQNGLCNISGTTIKENRIRLNLSQEQLAAELQLLGLNINQKAISRIESGERIVPDYELIYFARVLNVTFEALLKYSHDHN